MGCSTVYKGDEDEDDLDPIVGGILVDRVTVTFAPVP